MTWNSNFCNTVNFGGIENVEEEIEEKLLQEGGYGNGKHNTRKVPK